MAALLLPLAAHAALVWDTREVQLAANSNAREIVAQYRFTNAGASPVAIVDVVTSCDCTTVELTKRVYAPGETGTLMAKLALGSVARSQEETIAVVTDGAPAEPVVLHLRAEIQPLVTLSSPLLIWPTGAEPQPQEVLVQATGALAIRSLAITGTHPRDAVTARIEPEIEGAKHRVWVRPLSTARPQNFAVSCRVTFLDGTTQEVVVRGRTAPAAARRESAAARGQ
ncbi:DUF1573 domain-containing protein [Opitutus terrae]|uniref:DUF1573 domain-containing protein n=1 Tax=Opitutus terrae TaxID=107709 RepID=UPI0002DC5113|nr:DUF1573 domain-containing protein [Opitutus terrae]